MKKILSIFLILFLHFSSYSQDDKKAIKTSKEVYSIILNNDFQKLYEKLEDTRKAQISIEQIKTILNTFNKSLNNSFVDFENFKSEIIVPLETKSKFDYIVYRFPLIGESNNKDYFEVSFILKNNFSKIFSANIIEIDKMPDITVKYGAEYEEIPKVGEVITEKNSKTGFIEKIKYRDFDNLIVIEFSEKQVKISESKFLLENLKYKKITKLHENGNISLIASYDNGIVIGEFRKYYENGNPEASGVYLENLKKDKIWNYYDENGVIVKTEKYQNGKLVK